MLKEQIDDLINQYLTTTFVKITSPKNLHPLEGFWKSSHFNQFLEKESLPVGKRSHLQMLFHVHPYPHQEGCKSTLIMRTYIMSREFSQMYMEDN